MSIKDLSNAWDEAARCALEAGRQSGAAPQQLSNAAGLHIRTGLAAGGPWGITDYGGCTDFKNCW